MFCVRKFDGMVVGAMTTGWSQSSTEVPESIESIWAAIEPFEASHADTVSESVRCYNGHGRITLAQGADGYFSCPECKRRYALIQAVVGGAVA